MGISNCSSFGSSLRSKVELEDAVDVSARNLYSAAFLTVTLEVVGTAIDGSEVPLHGSHAVASLVVVLTLDKPRECDCVLVDDFGNPAPKFSLEDVNIIDGVAILEIPFPKHSLGGAMYSGLSILGALLSIVRIGELERSSFVGVVGVT